jgi:3-dehydroquinate synthetase
MAAVASGAVESGDLAEADADRLTDLLVTFGLLERYDEAAALRGLSRWLLADKKRDADGLHWVVPEGVGRARIGTHTTLDDIWLRDV